jgi:hypothetical protein
MATFWKRKLKDGGVSWEASIRRKGQPVQRKSFDTRVEAEAWAFTVESEMSKGVFVGRWTGTNKKYLLGKKDTSRKRISWITGEKVPWDPVFCRIFVPPTFRSGGTNG